MISHEYRSYQDTQGQPWVGHCAFRKVYLMRRRAASPPPRSSCCVLCGFDVELFAVSSENLFILYGILFIRSLAAKRKVYMQEYEMFVALQGEKQIIGQIVSVQIKKALTHSLLGERA